MMINQNNVHQSPKDSPNHLLKIILLFFVLIIFIIITTRNTNNNFHNLIAIYISTGKRHLNKYITAVELYSVEVIFINKFSSLNFK